MIFILILFNVFVYVFYSTIVQQRENTTLEDKITSAQNDLNAGAEGVSREEFTNSLKDIPLGNYANEDDVVYLIDRNNNILNSFFIFRWDSSIRLTNAEFDDLTMAYRKFSTKPIPKSTEDPPVQFLMPDGTRVLYKAKPIEYVAKIGGPDQAMNAPPEKTAVANIYIFRQLTDVENNMKSMLIALLSTSAGALLIAVFGTYWFTRRLTQPIQSMLQTIREIYRSGKLIQIELDKKEQTAEMVQLARSFNQMVERLDRTLNRQKQFVADASHELKTPLTIITSYANMLKRWGRDDEKTRDEAIEAISNEAERLKNLTESMLKLAEAEQEDWLNVERFDLVQLSVETADMLHNTFKRMIRTKTPAKQYLYFNGDKEKIRQLLVILLDNAIKYSKEPIDLQISGVKGAVRIVVADKGVGIAEENIPHMYDRFYRTDSARGRDTGGVGLGMSIAKRIVDLHGGKIDVFSKLGEGTTFSIVLPFRK
jgi:signal transduction histidine kinase